MATNTDIDALIKRAYCGLAAGIGPDTVRIALTEANVPRHIAFFAVKAAAILVEDEFNDRLRG
jgi:hypothetical protein